ncbi:MAG: hypothetical protein RBQ99_07510 [Trichlorobacter sp.]|nr:hypothetical protein [Trichlorobacter sp.]
MTKFQKQMLTLAAAGALSAVTALPAMAFENEFHGLFNTHFTVSNYNNGGSGDMFQGLAPVNGTVYQNSKHKKTNNYLQQRLRLQYIAKASDDLKLVTQFEVNNLWGDRAGGVAGANGQGGGLDTDGVNLQTKHVYLDFNVGQNFNTKVGLQAYKDTLKGIYIDADLPAIMTTTKFGKNYTLALGYSRYGTQFEDGSNKTRLGGNNLDLFIMDNTFAFNKDTKATFSYYMNADYRNHGNDNTVHTFGLGGQTKVSGVDVSGFVAMQAGSDKSGAKHAKNQGWAANIAAKAKVGPGVARAGFLYTSGDKDSKSNNKGWRPVMHDANNGTVNTYNESGLIILARNTVNSPTTSDNYLRRNISDIGVGYLGYDAKLTEKINLDGGVGFAFAGEKNDHKGKYMGTEIGLTAGYQLYKNLKLMAQAGYVVLGDYYKNNTPGGYIATTDGSKPANPYTARLQARFNF